MKYEIKTWMIRKGTLVDDKTMKQVLRRLSKTARRYYAEHGDIAIDVDGYCFTLRKSQFLWNIRSELCSKVEYQLFTELAWRNNRAIKAYTSMWALLHEINALQ